MSLVANSITPWGQSASGFLNELVASGQNVTLLKPSSIGGFLFSHKENATIKLESDITEYASEDGSNLSQNISKKNPTISFRGTVTPITIRKNILDELLNRVSKSVAGVQNILGSVGVNLSPTMVRTYNRARSTSEEYLQNAERLQRSATNFIDIFSDSNRSNLPYIKAYKQLNTMWYTKQIFDVVPFNNLEIIYNNMAIKQIEFIEIAELPEVVEISIELKQLNIVNTQTVAQSQDEITKILRATPQTRNTRIGISS